jgi:hypothetical protein
MYEGVYSIVSYAFCSRNMEVANPNYSQEWFVKCGCPVDISALMMMYRNLLKMKKVTGIVCTVFGLSTSKVCEVQIVIQVLDQQLTRPEEQLSFKGI